MKTYYVRSVESKFGGKTVGSSFDAPENVLSTVRLAGAALRTAGLLEKGVPIRDIVYGCDCTVAYPARGAFYSHIITESA